MKKIFLILIAVTIFTAGQCKADSWDRRTYLKGQPIRSATSTSTTLGIHADGSIGARIVDHEGHETEVSTGSLSVIQHEHRIIHENKHFFASTEDSDIDTDAPKAWYLATTTDTFAYHATIFFTAASPGSALIFQNPTLSSIGTSLPIFNNNANSSRTPQLVFGQDPVITSSGTLIFTTVIGSDGVGAAGGEGGILERPRELILKTLEEYLLIFVPQGNNTRASLLLEMYEGLK
jgi:hypothetical protein